MEQRINSLRARSHWRELLDSVNDMDIIIERYGQPEAVLIPYHDYCDIQEALEDMRSEREAREIYEQEKGDQSVFEKLTRVETTLKVLTAEVENLKKVEAQQLVEVAAD